MKTPENNNTQCKNPKCTCTDCKCDPCECNDTSCCGKSGEACSSTWCNWKYILFCTLLFLSILLNIFFLSNYGYDNHREYKKDSIMRDMEHSMKTMNHMTSHDPMDMSMRDMGSMLAGKTGAELNKAFLEGMIPHHQGAIEMAKYLAGSDKPELVQLGADIIAAQQKEIDQMRQWMIEWGYTQTGTTQTGTMNMHMMPDGTMMHN